MNLKKVTACAIFGVLASAGNAKATMMEQFDTASLTKMSNSIQIGEVTSTWSSWDPANRMVYTYVKLRVEQTLKGKPVQEVLIRQAGGQAGGYGMVVHGMASFALRERALVFLQNDREGAPTVAGMAQGKFRIFKSSMSGEDMAQFQAPNNLEFFTRGGDSGQVRHVVAGHAERRVSLRTLVGEIQQNVSAGQGLLSQ